MDHAGKSYILNQLLKSSGGFEVGSGYKPVTKGRRALLEPAARVTPGVSDTVGRGQTVLPAGPSAATCRRLPQNPRKAHRLSTPGLWLWSAPLRRTALDGSFYYLVLLDTEGSDAYDQVMGCATALLLAGRRGAEGYAKSSRAQCAGLPSPTTPHDRPTDASARRGAL